MSNYQQTDHALIESCKYVSFLIEKSALEKGQLTANIILSEAFTPDDFDKLIRSTEKYLNKLPAEMSNTRNTLTQGISKAQDFYEKFRENEIPGDDFAQLTSEFAGLLQAVSSSLQVLKNRKDEFLQAEQTDDQKVASVLDEKGRKALDAAIDDSFKPADLLSNLFGVKKVWLGLTSDKLREDIEALTIAGLKKVLAVAEEAKESGQPISNEDLNTLADESGLEAPEAEAGGEEAPEAEAGGEEAGEEPAVPTLSSVLFTQIDSNNPKKGYRFKNRDEQDEQTAKIMVALGQTADSWKDLEDKGANSASRKSLMRGLVKLKGALQNVNVESKQKSDFDFLIERWQKLTNARHKRDSQRFEQEGTLERWRRMAGIALEDE